MTEFAPEAPVETTDVAAPVEAPPAAEVVEAPTPVAAELELCNAPDCTNTPTTRGLCDAHYASLRGLADPKE